MQWKSMLWWMGAVLLLACLLSSNKSRSQDMEFLKVPLEENKVVFSIGKAAYLVNKTVRSI